MLYEYGKSILSSEDIEYIIKAPGGKGVRYLLDKYGKIGTLSNMLTLCLEIKKDDLSQPIPIEEGDKGDKGKDIVAYDDIDIEPEDTFIYG